MKWLWNINPISSNYRTTKITQHIRCARKYLRQINPAENENKNSFIINRPIIHNRKEKHYVTGVSTNRLLYRRWLLQPARECQGRINWRTVLWYGSSQQNTSGNIILPAFRNRKLSTLKKRLLQNIPCALFCQTVR